MNIILIISDTFRYDNLFDRAGMAIRTPELDRFSRRAVSLERMYTASFPTIPQRTDTTSGRYTWPWHPWQDRRLSSPNHMPDILREAGYISQLICDCPHLFRAAINEGFDGSYATRGQEGDAYLLRMNHPIEEAVPSDKTRQGSRFQDRNLVDLARWVNWSWYREEDRFAPRTARLAVEWLEENYLHHPFFLWVDFFDPHEPWDPPEYMVKRYDPEYAGAPMLHPNYGLSSDYSGAELRNLRAHYAAEVEMTDRWIGRILQKIDDLDLWRSSIVVFTSDHGISIGEHGRTGKSNISARDRRAWPIYPEVAHVPYMIAAPGLEGGRSVHVLTQPPDTLPTLLDMVGIQTAPPAPFHGRSFAPILRGESDQPIRDFAITAQHLRPDGDARQPSSWTTPVLYTERWAYAPIGAQGVPELYDLTSDPYAESDVASQHPDVVAQLHESLLSWLRSVDAPAEAIQVFE